MVKKIFKEGKKMYEFELSNPTKIFFGEQERNNIGRQIAKYGKNILVVYGGGSIKRSGLFDDVVALLNREGLAVYEFSGVQSNPKHAMVNEGAELCRTLAIDAILAIGGGSVIDCAKAISVASFYMGDCWDIITKKVEIHNALPIFAIMTISGTGTEMNNSCVISNAELKMKRGFSSELIRVKAAYLDPTLTYSVNKFQTACGAADTLSHILDTAYFVNGDKMQMLNGIMESVCRTIIKYGPIAIQEPENYEARTNLMWASTWGLNGLLKNGIKQLAACHAIEHELSARYDITHGHGMAIVMPRYYRSILDSNNIKMFAQFGRNVFDIDCNLTDEEAAFEMLNQMENFLFNDLALPSKLSDIGINDSEFEIMANNICWGGSLPGLKAITTEDVVNIFYACL